jgi:hypothetical protein
MVLHKSVEYSQQEYGHTTLIGSALFWDITQCKVVIKTGVLGLIGRSEMQVEKCHTKLSNIPEQSADLVYTVEEA